MIVKSAAQSWFVVRKSSQIELSSNTKCVNQLKLCYLISTRLYLFSVSFLLCLVLAVTIFFNISLKLPRIICGDTGRDLETLKIAIPLYHQVWSPRSAADYGHGFGHCFVEYCLLLLSLLVIIIDGS